MGLKQYVWFPQCFLHRQNTRQILHTVGEHKHRYVNNISIANHNLHNLGKGLVTVCAQQIVPVAEIRQ